MRRQLKKKHAGILQAEARAHRGGKGSHCRRGLRSGIDCRAAHALQQPVPAQRRRDALEDAGPRNWTDLVGVCKLARFERFRPDEGPWLYCFTSLSPERVDAEFAGGHKFSAEKPGIELKAIDSSAGSLPVQAKSSDCGG